MNETDKDEIIEKLTGALKAAKSHLEYCGYGDKWERELAKASRLPEVIDAALELAEVKK